MQRNLEVSNTSILSDGVEVANLDCDGSRVKLTMKNGEFYDEECEESQFEIVVPTLLLAETEEEPEDPDRMTAQQKALNWIKQRPGVLGFGITFIILGIVLTGVWFVKFYKPPVPPIDPFVLEEDNWKFPEAREHPYPDFAFLDKYDPDDEFGVTTKMDAPSPRTLTEAKKLNEDVKGWIKVPGTAISYPVLHTDMGNSYYLNRNILKQQVLSGNTDGVIFADTQCVIDNRSGLKNNTVVYGHNWTNRENNSEKARINNPEDKQFAPLISFSDSSFAQKYRRIVLTTADGVEQQFAIFAAFYIDVSGSSFFAYNTVDPKDTGYTELINKAKEASLYEYPVSVSNTDKIITLSTCSVRYTKTGGGRFVVMGKLVDSKGSIPTTALKVK